MDVNICAHNLATRVNRINRMKERFGHLWLAKQFLNVVWYMAGCLQGFAINHAMWVTGCVIIKTIQRVGYTFFSGFSLAIYNPIMPGSPTVHCSVYNVSKYKEKRFKSMFSWLLLRFWDTRSVFDLLPQHWYWMPWRSFAGWLTVPPVFFAWLLTTLAGRTWKQRLISRGVWDMCSSLCGASLLEV